MIKPKLHGYLDYGLSLVLLAAPILLGLSKDAAITCYISAGLHTLLSVSTNYPMGVWKYLSFKVHGMIELGASIALLILPWLVGFQGEVVGRNFFVVSAIVLFGVWVGTDYQDQEKVQVSETLTEPLSFRRAG